MRTAAALGATLAAALALAGCGDGEPAAEPPAAEPPAATSPPPAEPAPAPAETGPTSSPDGRILVAEPAAGATVTSPVTVAGRADVFEANVTVTILDESGTELARDFTTATCGNGCVGDFSLELSFSVDEEMPGTIVVSEDMVTEEGNPPAEARVPVTLGP